MERNIRVYLYTRDLGENEIRLPNFVKHWGIVVKFMDELPGPRELILEANNVNGKLWAKKRVFKENEYMKLPGAQKKELKPKSPDETLRTSEDLLAELCDR